MCLEELGGKWRHKCRHTIVYYVKSQIRKMYKKQAQPTPNSHEDGKEHSAAIVKETGHLETHRHKEQL